MRFTRLAALSVLSLLLGGCAFPTYTSPEIRGSTDQTVVTVLKNRWDCPFCVLSLGKQGADFTPLYERNRDGEVEAFRLPAGSYTITYRHNTYPNPAASRRDTVELRAGRTYEVKACVVCGSSSPLLWIEDVETHEVVAGPSRWCVSNGSTRRVVCDKP